MNGFTKRMIMMKLQQVDPNTLYDYAKMYKLNVTFEQATDIANHLKQNQYDPTNASDRARMLKKLAQITDLETAKKMPTNISKVG